MRSGLWRGLALAALSLAGCRTAPSPPVVAEAITPCPKLEANVVFSCWWSGDDRPLSHCVLWKDNAPGCGLAPKAVAYFNRGAPGHRDEGYRPDGGWMGISIFEDELGRVGQRSERSTGERFLSHHSESPLIVAAREPLPPRWPRWPAGLEGGPEQRRPQ
ncbi:MULTISPECIES: hypothetical protein [unclassified Brevundimonas]|uniref:hypothetical protein n=1 Tax=unclassified Brevundimonas TaxID=2622653 RepID=UPI003F90D916